MATAAVTIGTSAIRLTLTVGVNVWNYLGYWEDEGFGSISPGGGFRGETGYPGLFGIRSPPNAEYGGLEDLELNLRNGTPTPASQFTTLWLQNASGIWTPYTLASARSAFSSGDRCNYLWGWGTNPAFAGASLGQQLGIIFT